jgi:hypothetical protein
MSSASGQNIRRLSSATTHISQVSKSLLNISPLGFHCPILVPTLLFLTDLEPCSSALMGLLGSALPSSYPVFLQPRGSFEVVNLTL